MFIILGMYNLGIIFAAVEKLVRPPSPPRHEIVTTMGKVANIRHCVATGHWLSHWSQIVSKSPLYSLKIIHFEFHSWTHFSSKTKMVIWKKRKGHFSTNSQHFFTLILENLWINMAHNGWTKWLSSVLCSVFKVKD